MSVGAGRSLEDAARVAFKHEFRTLQTALAMFPTFDRCRTLGSRAAAS